VSLHCAAMCGPLACAMRANPRWYHLSRLISYTIAGGLFGAIGQSAAAVFHSEPLKLAPWMLAAVLLLLAFGLDRRLPQPRFLSGALFRARLGSSLGLLTPLIPCGPLWLILGVAAATSSWFGGAVIAGSFAAGTVPLYWLFQSQFFRAEKRLSPVAIQRVQRCLAFGSAMLLIWRASLPGHACCF
jgi:sulfite exporter TauE/SafE